MISREKFSIMKAFSVPELKENVAIYVKILDEFLIFDKSHEKIGKLCEIVEKEYYCEDLSIFGKKEKIVFIRSSSKIQKQSKKKKENKALRFS